MSVYGNNSVYHISVPLVLVRFAADPAIAEIGSTVSAVNLRWGFNRDIDSARYRYPSKASICCIVLDISSSEE